MKAAIYCRISDDQTGEALGVTRQLEDCEALVGGLGWETYRVYTDNDISAASGKRRPEYRAMLADVEAGHIDAIVAWAPDRVYRKLGDLEELITILEKRGTLVRTVKAGEFDLSTGMGKMIARILGSVAQGEGDIKSERWKRSIRQRREQGRLPGTGRIYGMTVDGHLEPVEVLIARGIAADVIAGKTLSSVAARLNADGHPTSQGNPWRTQTLRQYLLNPRLAGHSVLNGEIVGAGQWQPVLDPDTWETVNALLTVRGGKAKGPRVNLLPGILRCGECDTLMVSATRTDATKGKVRMYRCSSKPGHGGCGKISGDALPVEEVVEAFAKALLQTPEVRARAVELASSQGSRDALGEISALEARLLELDAQLAEPGVPVATIMRAVSRTKERLEEARRALVDAQPVAVPNRGGSWPSDLQRRRRLVELALDGRPVHLDRSQPSRGFDPRRVRIGERPEA